MAVKPGNSGKRTSSPGAKALVLKKEEIEVDKTDEDQGWTRGDTSVSSSFGLTEVSRRNWRVCTAERGLAGYKLDLSVDAEDAF